MGHIISRLYMFGEFIIPPRLHLRIEHSRVKNMLPSYTQVPEDCTDSELESDQIVTVKDEQDAQDADDDMEGTIRIHLKDDQIDPTIQDVSQIVADRVRKRKPNTPVKPEGERSLHFRQCVVSITNNLDFAPYRLEDRPLDTTAPRTSGFPRA
ncbi:unnamed protein product [Heligmosomoides polygyrus]|uniref:Helitron helicase n=1 Tax=Heligmosomoides polygyrus TaxID=6339 RepID=A0A3P8BTG9_HELPZ|nr:unnamed protein product [Heligmosomoides polygyrus]